MKTHYLKLAFSLLIALALVAGSLPHSARAATKCVSYYTVEAGDTTPKISKSFGLKWYEIAAANNLDRAWKPVAGTSLCIPAEGSTQKGTSGITTTTSVPGDRSASISAQVAGKKVIITGAAFKKKQVFFIKVRDASDNVGGWIKVGTFKIPKDTTKSQSYPLPEALRNEPYIDVCMKNALTDELICRTVLHTG